MTFLEFWKLKFSPLDPIVYPEDVTRLRNLAPELAGFTDEEIGRMWSSFSTRVYSAGWLDPTCCFIEGFRKELHSQMGDHDYQDIRY